MTDKLEHIIYVLRWYYYTIILDEKEAMSRRSVQNLTGHFVARVRNVNHRNVSALHLVVRPIGCPQGRG